MPRSRSGRSRGASAPEYALGVAVLAVALIGGVQLLEDAAEEQYDDRQALVATPVTDVGGATTTSTSAPAGPATLPPPATTTTTQPTLSLTASGVAGSGTNWSITFTVTSTASTGTVTATASGSGRSGSCVLAGGTCTGSITGLKGQDGDQSVTATAPGSSPSNPVVVAVP